MIEEKEQVLKFIRKHESLQLKPYKCPANKLTIGYGHVITEKDIINNSISESKAEELLLNDFEFAYSQVSKDSLPYTQTLAMSHFAFACGIGAYKKSLTRKMLLKGEVVKAANHLQGVYISYVDKNGSRKFSRALKEQRIFESKLLLK